MDNMLGEMLRNVCGPFKDLLEKLSGADGEAWLTALKRFLRKENPWPVLTPTTYGAEIKPPFEGAILVEDGPGDEMLDPSKLELIPVLKKDDRGHILVEEAVNRSRANPETNWGQRAAFAIRDAGNAKKIPESVWKVGEYVIFGKTVWRRRDGFRSAWYVIRDEDGFYCLYCWFSFDVHSCGRLLRLCK